MNPQQLVMSPETSKLEPLFGVASVEWDDQVGAWIAISVEERRGGHYRAHGLTAGQPCCNSHMLLEAHEHLEGGLVCCAQHQQRCASYVVAGLWSDSAHGMVSGIGYI